MYKRQGYPDDVSRKSDGLMRFFREFLAENETAGQMYRNMELPVITKELIGACLDEIPVEADREYIQSFILNGQTAVQMCIRDRSDSACAGRDGVCRPCFCGG